MTERQIKKKTEDTTSELLQTTMLDLTEDNGSAIENTSTCIQEAQSDGQEHVEQVQKGEIVHDRIKSHNWNEVFGSDASEYPSALLPDDGDLVAGVEKMQNFSRITKESSDYYCDFARDVLGNDNCWTMNIYHGSACTGYGFLSRSGIYTEYCLRNTVPSGPSLYFFDLDNDGTIDYMGESVRIKQ